jgi:DNA-binding MarR family transcriptional regulator
MASMSEQKNKRSATGAAPVSGDSRSRWLGHLLWDVSRRTSGLGEAALASTPLSLSTLGVLDWIAACPGITVADITRRVPTSQQAISQAVARLQNLGLVERRVADGRRTALYITRAGADARALGCEVEADFERRLEEALGRDRYERLRELLAETRDIVIDLGQSRADEAPTASR